MKSPLFACILSAGLLLLAGCAAQIPAAPLPLPSPKIGAADPAAAGLIGISAGK